MTDASSSKIGILTLSFSFLIYKVTFVAKLGRAPFGEGRNNMFTNPTLAKIGAKYNKSVAQVILRWLIQRGVIVVCKSTHLERIKENFDVFDFTLSDEDMKEIKTLDTNDSLFFNHQDPKMVEWFDDIVKVRRQNQDATKEKKNW